MRVHIGGDHAAYDLKFHLVNHLLAQGHDVVAHRDTARGELSHEIAAEQSGPGGVSRPDALRPGPRGRDAASLSAPLVAPPG